VTVILFLSFREGAVPAVADWFKKLRRGTPG